MKFFDVLASHLSLHFHRFIQLTVYLIYRLSNFLTFLLDILSNVIKVKVLNCIGLG